MNSKKVPSLERAVLPRTADRTKVHVEDRMPRSHSGRYAMRRRREILLLPVSCADSDKKIARLGPAQPILMHRNLRVLTALPVRSSAAHRRSAFGA